MYNENCLYWLWLADKCGVASKDFPQLIDKFETPFEIYRLEPEEIDAISFIGDRLKAALSDKSLELAYSTMRYCKDNRISIITYADKDYPESFKEIKDPPVLFYCLGKMPKNEKRLFVGIVGTRKISAYGMQAAYKISYELAAANACIVSGMALGIDAVAACGALEAGGETVAVLGCGIDVVYPKAHAKLKRIIASRGAVITEYPPATLPEGRNFPIRNRLISALSRCVVVVEGNLSSGALITAEKALLQGRELFALPGKVNESNSDGPNELIQSGANVILRSEDIIEYYDYVYRGNINYKGLKKAKNHSDIHPRNLEKYGVSSEVYFGARESVRISNESPVSPMPATSDQNSNNEQEMLVKKSKETGADTDVKADNSKTALAALDTATRRVFDLMPVDRAVSADEFSASGIGIAEAMTSLTMLELYGLVSSLPGGMYIRK